MASSGSTPEKCEKEKRLFDPTSWLGKIMKSHETSINELSTLDTYWERTGGKVIFIHCSISRVEMSVTANAASQIPSRMFQS